MSICHTHAMRICRALALVVAAAVVAGCSSSGPVATAPVATTEAVTTTMAATEAVTAPVTTTVATMTVTTDVATTVVGSLQIPPTRPNLVPLRSPDDVLALVQAFGACVVGRVPGPAALAIWFDPATGLVGTTRTASSGPPTSPSLDEALYQCDNELVYRPSLNAWIAANPMGGALGANGLPLDRGEQLPFGDPALARTLVQR